MKHTNKAVILMALIFGLTLAPVANAGPRETGVGQVIAAQGNVALELIKAEIKQAIHFWQPTLDRATVAPAATLPTASKVSNRIANASGAGISGSTRCAP